MGRTANALSVPEQNSNALELFNWQEQVALHSTVPTLSKIHRGGQPIWEVQVVVHNKCNKDH